MILQIREAKALTDCILNEKGGYYKIKGSVINYANELVFLGEMDKLLEKYNW